MIVIKILLGSFQILLGLTAFNNACEESDNRYLILSIIFIVTGAFLFLNL